MKKLIPFFILFSLMMTSITNARVLCPRVISEHNADLSDWQRFRIYHEWKDKSGQDLALAIWNYLSDTETGVYHFNEILEGDDPFSEYATVRDPMKILNVYNMGYCGIFGPVLDGVFQNIGFEEGRSFGVNLWNHCATELKYDNEWHYFDLDVRGVLLDEKGEVISLHEAQTQREYWVNPPVSIEPFFPNVNNKDEVFEIYRDSRVDFNYRWFEGSHTMDLVLRQGESFTRWWEPQGGRWNHRPLYNEIDWVRELILEDPVGMKPNHRHFTKWNHGNGLFEYIPNLTDNSTDFYDGVFSSLNLKPGENGLEFINDGNAEAVFEVFTPYIIVAKVNDLDDFSDDAQASMLTLSPLVEIQISVSLNRGKTWQRVKTINGSKTSTVDLTRWTKGTYGYLLKLEMDGKQGETALKSMNIETWVQVAPISLPRLKKGINHLSYKMGDRFGLQTEPVLITPNTADPNDLKQYLTKLPNQYNPDEHTSRIRGEAILHLQAPKGKPITWFSVGATFRTHQGEAAKQTNNRILYAVGEPENFKEIYKANVPTWVNHWRYNWDTDVRLDEPANDVYVKYIGDPAVNTIRACLHVQPKQTSQKRISITHGYEINNQLQTQTIHMDQPDDYTIECSEEPENKFIKIAVPSHDQE